MRKKKCFFFVSETFSSSYLVRKQCYFQILVINTITSIVCTHLLYKYHCLLTFGYINYSISGLGSIIFVCPEDK